MSRVRYYVETWDPDRQTWTPQKGVRKGPYSKWGLRRALRALRDMGYGHGRHDSVSALVYTVPHQDGRDL